MKARLVRPMEAAPSHPLYKPGQKTWLPVGTIIEHPHAYMLVRQGCARSADDECKQAARMTEGQWQAAFDVYEKVRRGIAPEDYEAFDRGEIDYDESPLLPVDEGVTDGIAD